MTNQCEKVHRLWIEEACQNELSAEERAFIDEHLLTCPTCRLEAQVAYEMNATVEKESASVFDLEFEDEAERNRFVQNTLSAFNRDTRDGEESDFGQIVPIPHVIERRQGNYTKYVIALLAIAACALIAILTFIEKPAPSEENTDLRPSISSEIPKVPTESPKVQVDEMEFVPSLPAEPIEKSKKTKKENGNKARAVGPNEALEEKSEGESADKTPPEISTSPADNTDETDKPVEVQKQVVSENESPARPSTADEAIEESAQPVSGVHTKNLIVGKWAYGKLSQVYELIGQKKYDAALRKLDEINARINLNRHERAKIMQTYGQVWTAKGDYSKAIWNFKKSLTLNALPKSATQESRFMIAQLYMATDKPSEAIRYFEQWMSNAKKPNPSSYYMIAMAYTHAKDYSRALYYAKKAVTGSKNPPKSWTQLVSSLENNQNIDATQSELKKKAQDINKTTKDTDPIPLLRVQPEYPPQAAQHETEGWVIVEFTIDKNGAIKHPRVIKNYPSDIFNRNALVAIRKWKYKPKMVNGKPVESPGVRVKLTFNLDIIP